MEMEDAETVDARVAPICFNESSHYVLPAFKAVVVLQSIVQHDMMH
jgi:hypothetical protein